MWGQLLIRPEPDSHVLPSPMLVQGHFDGVDSSFEPGGQLSSEASLWVSNWVASRMALRDGRDILPPSDEPCRSDAAIEG